MELCIYDLLNVYPLTQTTTNTQNKWSIKKKIKWVTCNSLNIIESLTTLLTFIKGN